MFFTSKLKQKIQVLPGINRLIQKAFTDKFLLSTNTAISFILSAAGDILEQRYELAVGEVTSYDYVRTKNMSLSGVTSGFITHYWYIVLDRYIPGYSLSIVIKKIVADQLVCSPVTILNMFIVVGYLENKSMKQIRHEVETKYLKLYKAEWIVWPPAQFVNFLLIPRKFRLLYDNLVSFGYDVYYSAVKHTS